MDLNISDTELIDEVERRFGDVAAETVRRSRAGKCVAPETPPAHYIRNEGLTSESYMNGCAVAAYQAFVCRIGWK